MKKIYVLLAILSSFIFSAQSQVVINEVYGGGGNSGAVYKQDFIELYNNGATAVDLSTWSVQYASATGTTWTRTNLVGTIAPQGYYLIQQATGTGGTTNIPTPDATGTTAMSGTAGKIVLVNNQTTLSGSCPTGPQIVDVVGFGLTANCFEGGGPTPAPSNTTSVQRIFTSNTAQDTQNNNVDFTAGSPSPMNAGGAADLTPPSITTLSPANGATNVGASLTATITFNETIVKGTSGTINVKRISDDVIIQSFDITTSAVTVTGASASFAISGLAFNTTYYIEITANAFKDLANNNFAGISGNSTWSFTTAAGAPVGEVGTTYSFTTCSGTLPDGFTQYNVLGTQVWGCTTFGHDFSSPTASAPNGVQINGFAGGTNVPNEDWLITPAYDLTATAFPLLSFWSRNAFNGLPLKLKISTNYVSGHPNLATWTDLNGKFPNQASDVWTLSNNINLSSYKTTNVRIAFVYNSSDDEGARWTLDDILIANSATPPPASLTLSATDIQFGFVATPGNSVETFTFTANDITGPVTVTATSNFSVSKNNVDFTQSLTYLHAEANNVSTTVYVRFMPPVNNQDFTGTVTLSTQGLTDTTVNLRGTSIDPVNTLEVVNWNIEWFGSTTLGPTNDGQQQANVTTILNNVGADIYGLTEIVSEPRLQAVVGQMPGYAYVLSNYGSHTNTSANPPGALAEAQKLAFVYKTSVFSNVTATPLLSQGINTAADLVNPAYNYFASGRFPYMMTADVTLNGVTRTVRFVLIHGKANTSPTATSYARRKAGADTLAYTLNNLFPNDRILILGDFNDDLDQSITAGFTTTSYSAFTTDNTHYFAPTLALSLAGKKSTISYNDVIDHVVLSNEMQCYYMNSTANILTDVTSLVTNYGSTTSDHYPVFTRYAFTPGPSATISYQGAAYCQNAGSATPTFAGTANGTFSSTSGLTIDSNTGVVTLATSTPGTYTVTYTVAATNCDPVYTTSTTITVTTPPAATIAYTGSPYCQNAGTASVSLTGTGGGTYSSTIGLTIHPTSGEINTVTSTPGLYLITYTIPATANCAATSSSANVTITATPSATISYPSATFCQNSGSATPLVTGTAGGNFSSTAGLSINAATGVINLVSSTPGSYTVSYTIPAAGGCSAVTTTTSVTVTALPAATISYTGSPYCQNAGTATVTRTGNTTGTFSSSIGLTINATTGAVTTTSSTPGSYIINYTIPASGGCPAVIATTSLTITATPAASISYSGSPFCTGATVITPTITGTPGGVFSSTFGLTINATTGAITLATSTAGAYVVTYRIAAAGGCAEFTTTATVNINSVSLAPTGATASTSTFCGDGLVNLSVQFAAGSLGTGASWKWYTGSCGGTLIGTGATLSNIAINTTTTYYVRAEGTCNTTTCASVTVTVNASPAVTITAAPYTSLLPGLTTTLTASITAGTGSTLTWYRNGVAVAGNNSNTITASIDQLGSYYASVNTVNNCMANSNTILIRDSTSDNLFISPNPNRGLFSVRYGSLHGQPASRILTIYDSKGARVFIKEFTLASTFSSMNVNLTGHGKGIYYIIVSDITGNKLAEGNVLVL